MRPSSVRSMCFEAGTAGSPGIVITSPHHDHEARARGRPDLGHVQLVAAGGAPQRGVGGEGVLRLGHAHRQAAVPVGLDPLEPPLGLAVPGHHARAVQPSGEPLDLRGQGQVVGEGVRRGLVDHLQDALASASGAGTSVREVRRRERRHPLGRHQIDDHDHLGVGVGGEAVQGDHARDPPDSAQAVRVPVKVRHAGLERLDWLSRV